MSENELKIKCPRCQQEIIIGLYIPHEAYTSQQQPLTIKTAEALFNSETAKNLTFQNGPDNTIIIKPKKYLGKTAFSKIAATVKAHGGEYVSNGKNSYFKIPAKQC